MEATWKYHTPHSMDFAIVYFGLTRSTKKVFESHQTHLFDVLDAHHLTYRKVMHTWRTDDDSQKVWETVVPQKIDYTEYALLSPDDYKIDRQESFLESICMDDYFYQDVWRTKGHGHHGEWLPGLVQNHLCALESMKRAFGIVEDFVLSGQKFRFVLFIRPDVMLHNAFPLAAILPFPNKIHIPDFDHYEGLNDRLAVMNFDTACLYGKRINELAEFRKKYGRIVSEKYVKFIVDKYKLDVHFIPFRFEIIRP